MDEKTRKALEKSIKHWEENCAAAKARRPVRISWSACALCRRFGAWTGRACAGCPVADASGTGSCDSTPYEDVVSLLYDHNSRIKSADINWPTLYRACRAELKFLESLKPKTPKKKRGESK